MYESGSLTPLASYSMIEHLIPYYCMEQLTA